MSQSIPISLQVTNNNNVNANTIPAVISQKFSNPITGNVADYDIHLISLTSSTTLPIYNILNYINWPSPQGETYSNFEVNRTNMTVSIVVNDGSYPIIFPIVVPNSSIMLFPSGQEDPANPGHWSGLGCYCQYYSENKDGIYLNPDYDTPIPNGVLSSSYPDSYFNVHSMRQHIEMINTAIYEIMSVFNYYRYPTTYKSVNQFNPFFNLDSSTGLISFNCPTTQNVLIPTPTPTDLDIVSFFDLYDLYCNDYAIKAFDGFRTSSLGSSIMNSILINGIQYPSNLGMDNVFIFNQNAPPKLDPTLNFSIAVQNFIFYNPLNNVPVDNIPVLYYTSYAEYNACSNIFDTQAVLITAENPCLKKINSTYISVKNQSVLSTSMSMVSCLKILDINFTNINIQSINNGYIQFQAGTLDRPLQFPDNLNDVPLDEIILSISSLDFNNVVKQIQIPIFGHFNIKLLLKNKKTGQESYMFQKIGSKK